DERFRLVERLHRLNDLGCHVEEVELRRTQTGYRLRLRSQVVEARHHRRGLLQLTGLRAQENQARRLLGDIEGFRAELAATGRPAISEASLAGRWLDAAFEPAVAA